MRLRYFNSIKVRLEHPIVSKYRAYSLFQFHKGTIRTVMTISQKWYKLFQFHKGTIRTNDDWLLVYVAQISIP